MAISMDDAETLRKFRASLEAKGRFVADPQGRIVKAFQVKMPLLPIANRVTFVVGEGRRVLAVQSGSAAIDPSGAIAACPVR